MTKDQQKKELILNHPNIYKGLIVLALPVMLNNFIKTIHDIIDMFFVSKIPEFSTEAISSISLTFPVNFTYVSLGIGLSAAGTALMSQFIGANKLKDAKKYAGNLLIISVLLGIFLNIFSYFLSPSIMQLMGTKDYVLEQSSLYLKIRSFELPFVFLFFAFTSIRQSSGDTTTAVYFGIATVVLNIILTPIFVSVLNMGVSGAAYATLISNVVITPFMLYVLFFSKSGITVSKSDFQIDGEIIHEITERAIPASLGQAFTAIGFIIMNAMIVGYGDQTVAAFSVGNRINSLILQPVMAIGAVLATYIGQNIGNNQPERAREAFKKAMSLSVAIMIVGATIFMFLRKPMILVFLDDDPVAYKQAYEYMFYLLLGIPLMAVFQTFLGLFNGTGHTRFTFIITVTRLWILRIPMILLFGYFTSLAHLGIWIAMFISNFLIMIPGFILYKQIDFKPIIKQRKNHDKDDHPIMI